MRILLAAAAYPPYVKGGGAIGSSLLARGLSGLGHTVRVVTMADRETLTSENGVEVKTINSLNVYWDYWKHNPLYKKVIWHTLENFNPRSLFRMRREIREFRPDIVVTLSVENINVATWMAARLERTPVAHLIQSSFLVCWKGSMARNGHNCRTQCANCRVSSVGKKALSRYVNGVTAETNFILNLHLQRGYFPNAISRVIPGAVDFSRRSSALNLDRNTPLRVGFIGVHTAHKGLGTLAAVAHALAKQNVAHFYIAGDEPPRGAEKWHDRFPSSNTRFLGWMNPEDFFQQIDLLVVPSLLIEAFGRVSVEAMCCGVPVICSRTGGLSENVVEGENGFTIAPGDRVDLADKISLLAADRDRLARMGAYAARYAERFRLETVSSAFATFLGDVRDRVSAGEQSALTPTAAALPLVGAPELTSTQSGDSGLSEKL